jgi:hypothetical protein
VVLLLPSQGEKRRLAFLGGIKEVNKRDRFVEDHQEAEG